MKKILGILIILALIGMVFVGCSNVASDGGNPALQGTWKTISFDIGGGNLGYYKLIVAGSNWELQINNTSGVLQMAQKGTYSTNGNNMTMTATHTKTPPADWISNSMTMSGTYEISGNTLTVTFDGESPLSFTK